MDYFSLEILDHFSKKTGKPLRLLEAGKGTPNPQSHVVFSTSLEGYATPVRGHEQELTGQGLNPQDIEAQAGPSKNEAAQVTTPTGQTLFVWWTQGEDQPQQAKPKSNQAVKQDQLAPQVPSVFPQFQVLSDNAQMLLGDALQSFLQNTLSDLMLISGKRHDQSKNILAGIFDDLKLRCIYKKTGKQKIDPELGIPTECAPKDPQKREELKQTLLQMIQQRIFFQAAGSKQKSLADRLATASVVRVDEDGKLDLQSKISPMEAQQEVQKIFEKLIELAGKEKLDADDILFIKDKIQYLGGQDKIILYSEDGRLAISLGNTGAVDILSKWLENKYIESSVDENGKPQLQALSVKKLTEESYSSLLGDLVEDLTNLEIREQRYAGLIDQCKPNNPELCAQLQKEYESVRLEKAKVYVKLSSSCKVLLELGGSDMIGESEKIEQITAFHEQIKQLAALEGLDVTDPKQLDKVVKTAIQVGTFATVMIQQQNSVKLADWSVVTGQKRGANRKADLALFYFDENKAKLASESTKEIYESYDINDPKLSDVFQESEDDAEYLNLKKLMAQKCAGKVPCLVHVIRPSLKTKIGKKEVTTLGTTSADNTNDICDLVISGDDKTYSETFNTKHGKNLRKHSEHEATQLRKTIIDRAVSSGMKPEEAIKAVQKVKKYNNVLKTISEMASTVSTTTQGGTPVKGDAAKAVIKMFGPIEKELGITLQSLEQEGKEEKKEAKEIHSLLKSAGKYADKAAKSKDPKEKQVQEKLMREHLMKAAYYLQNAKRKKLANERDVRGNLTARAMEERRALAAELIIRGGSAKDDTVVIESNFRGKSSSLFTHNEVIHSHMKDLVGGKSDIKLLSDGISLSTECGGLGGCDKDTDRATISIRSDFTGGSAGSFVTTVNGNSVERSRIAKREYGVQLTNNRKYDKKLSLIKEMLEQQKELLLKIISPEL